MKEQEEHAANRIPSSNKVISQLLLWALCIASLFSGWYILRTSIDAPTAKFTHTSLMPRLASTSTPTGWNLIHLAGKTNEKYSLAISSSTVFNAANWTSNAVGPSPSGTTGRAVDIDGTNGGASGGLNIAWRGGTIIGSIPQTWNWSTTHDFGGAGFRIAIPGLIEWQFIRIHNVEDGIKPRETLDYSNTGSWLLRDCYFTAIRDDAIENDRFEPGTVQDCLLDGVFTFISEQDENVGSNTPIGPNEDHNIYIKHVYARLFGTNYGEGPGKWFKVLGDVPHHRFVVSDSVFAIGSTPRAGWAESMPTEINWVGDNNFLLWLGTPGEYGGPRPEGVIFLEGDAARNKWISVRNKWLTEHGLPPQNFSADYNPFDAPVMQIPTGF